MHLKFFSLIFFVLSVPMTAQPDFASVTVDYKGVGIRKESLLRYLVSFRKYAAFSEHIVERIYFDLLQKFSFTTLRVSALR